MPSLADLVVGSTRRRRRRRTDRAFVVWSNTDLATLSPDVGGRAVRRRRPPGQPLRAEPARVRHDAAPSAGLPAGTVVRRGVAVRIERAPRAAGQPRHLRARGAALGAIVVRVMLDYRTLPFISSQSPYLESLRPDGGRAAEGASGRDVEFVVYGWSRAPLYASGTSVWPLPDAVSSGWSSRASRSGRRSSATAQTFRVYFLSDRGGIYALGYPVITWFGHLINLAELVVLVVRALRPAARRRDARSTRSTSRTPASGRALLREDPIELLPQAVPRLRRRRGRAGRRSSRSRRARTSRRSRAPASRRRRAQDRDRRAAAGRRLRDAAAARHRRARRRSTIRSWCSSAARSIRTSTCSTARGCRRPASATCSRRGCCRRARRPTSTATIVLDRLPTFVGVEAGRRLQLPAGGGAGARRRPRGHRHGAADAAAAGDRAADRRARSPGAVRRGAVQPARRGARLLDGRADRRSGEPADARHAAHRARRSRRAHRRDLVGRTAAGWSRTSTDGRRPQAAARASSSARSGSRRGPTWRGRWRTTSRIR